MPHVKGTRETTPEPNGDRPRFSGFVLSDADSKVVNEWWSRHCQEKHKNMYRDMGDGGEPIFYTGATGGGLTYNFSPNSLGVTTTATCFCGEKLDFTDYDSW